MPVSTVPASGPWELRPGARWTTRGRTVTEADVVAFAAWTGDHHPVHTDATWARDEGPFGERVAHGLLVVAYALGLLAPGPDQVTALRALRSVVFKRPVRLGETIRVQATVEELRDLGAASLATLALAVLGDDDRLRVRAQVEVLTPGTVA